jgi:hypothetical protein
MTTAVGLLATPGDASVPTGPLAFVSKIVRSLKGVQVERESRFLFFECPNEASAVEIMRMMIALERMGAEQDRI